MVTKRHNTTTGRGCGFIGNPVGCVYTALFTTATTATTTATTPLGVQESIFRPHTCVCTSRPRLPERKQKIRQR